MRADNGANGGLQPDFVDLILSKMEYDSLVPVVRIAVSLAEKPLLDWAKRVTAFWVRCYCPCLRVVFVADHVCHSAFGRRKSLRQDQRHVGQEAGAPLVG